MDSKASIIDGIKSMIKMGVKPAIIPFRPFDKSLLNRLSPPNPDDLLDLSALTGYEMKKYQAKSKQFLCCEYCGACTLEKDFLTFLLPVFKIV